MRSHRQHPRNTGKSMNNTEEIKRLKQELKEWKSQEVRERFESVNSMAHIVAIKRLEQKIKALKRGEDI